jgi:trigger factor
MKIQIDSISEVKKKISVIVPEERIQQEVQDALDKAQKKAVLPGFRPGKAPRSMLEQKFGKAIEAEVCQDLLRSSMTQAIEENKLDAITISEMSEPKREIGKGLTFSASIEVRPSIEPKKYSGLEIKGHDSKVKDEDIQNVLTRLLDQNAVLKPVEDAKKAKKGEYVSMIVERLDDKGQSMEKETPQEQLHLIGHDQSIPEVDEAILKASIGDSTEVSIKQPVEHDHKHGEDCNHDHSAQQEMKLRLTLKSVKTKVLPELNDDFAKTVGPFDTLEALKKQVSQDLEKEMGDRNKVENVKALLAEVLKNNPTSLPDTLIENEMLQLKQEMFQHMMSSGMKQLPADFSEEKMTKELRPEAQRRVHEQLVLSAIAKKENIDVTPAEMNSRIEQYAQVLRKPIGEVRAQYASSGRNDALRFQILAQKTLDFLLAQANIKP